MAGRQQSIERSAGLPQPLFDLLVRQGKVSQSDNHVALADIQSLAETFGYQNAVDPPQLLDFLGKKSRDWLLLCAHAAGLDDRGGVDASIKAMVVQAAERLDLAEVEALLSHINVTNTATAATFLEVRGRNALLRGHVEEAADLFDAVADSTGDRDPLETARRKKRHAMQLYEHGLLYGGVALVLATELWRFVLTVFTKTDHPLDWAATMQSLALTLEAQGVRAGSEAGTALLVEAIESYRAALHIVTESTHPVYLARAMQNFAHALEKRDSMDGPAPEVTLLREAACCYREALWMRAEAEHTGIMPGLMPLPVALSRELGVQAGLERALPPSANLADLGNAAGVYRTSMRVLTATDHACASSEEMPGLPVLPKEATPTMGAKAELPLSGQAMGGYRTSLRVMMEADDPVALLGTIQDIAGAMRTQGARIGGEVGSLLLGEAMSCYRTALQRSTVEGRPVDWALARENMARLEKVCADHDTCINPRPHLEAGIAHVEAALGVLKPGQMAGRHDAATALRNQLMHQLAMLG